MLSPFDFFEIKEERIRSIFADIEYAWEALQKLKNFIKDNINPNVPELSDDGFLLKENIVLHEGKVIRGKIQIDSLDASKGKLTVKVEGQTLKNASLICAGASIFGNNIEIGSGVLIEPGALIKGPTIIGDESEVRQGAYIRGNVIVGNRCVVGHSTEIKHSILIEESKAGHFAYVGDSILGKVNLGAGTKLANLKITDSDINIYANGKTIKTGLRKMGAILGDFVQTGCNSVTSPGTLLGRGSILYPNTTASGYHPPNSIIKEQKMKHFTYRKGKNTAITR